MVEGIVNHNLLGLHRVNETAPREMWIYCDAAYLVILAVLSLWSVILLAIVNLVRRGRAR